MSEPPAYKPAYKVIEEDGKIYAVYLSSFHGREQELYQRLKTRDAKPGKTWYGTKLAADHA